MPFVDSDFSETQLTPPFSAGDHVDYDFTTASPTGMQFLAGLTQAIELSAIHGAGWLAYVIAPTSVHQAAEATVLAGTGFGSIARSGVFVRYTNSSNFVTLQYDHNTRCAVLRERVETVYNTLATSSAAPSEVFGVGLKLEVIGRRARWWFNPNFYLAPDRPPDGAADLTLVPDNPGDFGLFIENNLDGCDLRIAHFSGRELPNLAPPPPQVEAANAADFNFTPIKLTASPLPSGTISIEWQIAPNDPDDFSEIYTDVSPASEFARVFWVRDGYEYQCRARAISDRGVRGPWSLDRSIIASGSKVAPDSPTIPDDEFPDVIPDYVVDCSNESDASAILPSTQKEKTIRKQVRPRKSWHMTFDNILASDLQTIRVFFDAMQGMTKPFAWVHPTEGKIYAVRFASDEKPEPMKDPGANEGIFTLELSITEVVLGVVPTLTWNFELD